MTSLPIIDAHQHFWDLAHFGPPWLRNVDANSFRYGDYSALARTYMPKDYMQDTAGFDLVGSVYVEAEWGAGAALDETAWVHEVALLSGLPSAVVCHVKLDESNAGRLIEKQAAFSLVRGVRHKPRPALNRREIVTGAPGSMSDPVWRTGYGELARHGLSFDLQVPWWHLEEAAELNSTFPKTRIILNHSGLPADRSNSALDEWRAAIEVFASAPNVAIKISGLGLKGRQWSIEENRNIILDIVDVFGVDRCMFASNFPVDGLVGSFRSIFEGFFAVTRQLGAAAQRELFVENAKRIYRIRDLPVR